MSFVDDCIVSQTEENSNSDTTIVLENDLKLIFSGYENYGNFSTYEKVGIYYKNELIYSDASIEYEFSENKYPMIFYNGDATEIWLECNDRPFKSKSKKIIIQNHTVISNELLPLLDYGPINCDDDDNMELYGFLDYAEAMNNACYIPILFYEKSNGQLRLDSVLTVKVNSKIYGQFQGYTPILDYVLPSECNGRFTDFLLNIGDKFKM